MSNDLLSSLVFDFKGQQVALAKSVGLVLGYALNGQKLCDQVSTSRSYYEGTDYIVLRGPKELDELRSVVEGISPKTRSNILLTRTGMTKVLMKGRVGKGSPSRIYFVQAENGPIKIGHTKGSVEKRITAIQGMSPARLTLLKSIPGSHQEERALHKKFSAHKLWGEWFSAAPELLSFIGGLNG